MFENIRFILTLLICLFTDNVVFKFNFNKNSCIVILFLFVYKNKKKSRYVTPIFNHQIVDTAAISKTLWTKPKTIKCEKFNS